METNPAKYSEGSARLIPLSEITSEEWAEKYRMSVTRGEGKIESKSLDLIL